MCIAQGLYDQSAATGDRTRDARLRLCLFVTPLHQTTFENIVGKGFATVFLTFCINYTFIYRDFLGFRQHAFKVVCCMFAVCGKWLSNINYLV